MSKFGLAAIAAVAALALASPAQAGMLDNFQVKLGISGVLPNENGDPIDVSISDEYVPSLQIEYFFNDRKRQPNHAYLIPGDHDVLVRRCGRRGDGPGAVV